MAEADSEVQALKAVAPSKAKAKVQKVAHGQKSPEASEGGSTCPTSDSEVGLATTFIPTQTKFMPPCPKTQQTKQ